jgi:hypothetical protein
LFCRVPELEEELAAAQEANRTAEKRLKQLRESSGELGEKVEQLVGLEKERRERKLVISCVLLGTTDDNAREQVNRSAKGISDALVEWGALSNDGDSSCLTKIGNGYQLLLQSSVHSYYHCIRVLAQVNFIFHIWFFFFFFFFFVFSFCSCFIVVVCSCSCSSSCPSRAEHQRS